MQKVTLDIQPIIDALQEPVTIPDQELLLKAHRNDALFCAMIESTEDNKLVELLEKTGKIHNHNREVVIELVNIMQARIETALYEVAKKTLKQARPMCFIQIAEQIAERHYGTIEINYIGKYMDCIDLLVDGQTLTIVREEDKNIAILPAEEVKSKHPNIIEEFSNEYRANGINAAVKSFSDVKRTTFQAFLAEIEEKNLALVIDYQIDRDGFSGCIEVKNTHCSVSVSQQLREPKIIKAGYCNDDQQQLLDNIKVIKSIHECAKAHNMYLQINLPHYED